MVPKQAPGEELIGLNRDGGQVTRHWIYSYCTNCRCTFRHHHSKRVLMRSAVIVARPQFPFRESERKQLLAVATARRRNFSQHSVACKLPLSAVRACGSANVLGFLGRVTG